MTPAAERIAADLAELCFRAGAAPGDDSPAAGARVLAQVRADLGAAEPWPCPVAAWVRRRVPGSRCLVSVRRVILPGVVLSVERHQQGIHRVFEAVELPPAVRAAVAAHDARKGVA